MLCNIIIVLFWSNQQSRGYMQDLYTEPEEVIVEEPGVVVIIWKI
jgi:hypothetical protein